MRCGRRVALAAVASVVAVCVNADDMNATPARSFLDQIGAEAVDCASQGTCGVVDEPFKQLKKKIERLADEQSVRVSLDEGWRYPQGYRTRNVVIDGGLYTLRFDKESGVLAVAAHPSCFDSTVLDDPELYMAGEPGVSPIEIIVHATPTYPEQARAYRAGGYVVVQAIVERDGSIGARCVAHSSKAGYGFEESALEAVRQSRCAPATRDGKPVRALRAFPITWWIP